MKRIIGSTNGVKLIYLVVVFSTIIIVLSIVMYIKPLLDLEFKSNKSGVRNFTNGIQKYQEGEYNQAKRELIIAKKKISDHYMIQIELVKTYIKLSEIDNAIKELDLMGNDVDGLNYEAYLELIIHFMEQGEFDKAYVYFSKITNSYDSLSILTKPECIKLANKMATTLHKSNKDEDAINILDDYLKVKPSSIILINLLLLGDIYNSQGKYREAINTLNDVLEIDPNNQAAKDRLIELQKENNNKKQ